MTLLHLQKTGGPYGEKITLKELAAMTGTSVSTVSKALNQSTEISESTRRRIVEVARASHYQFGKQSLPEERQKIVGFLVPDVSIHTLPVSGEV